ncbi:hypothetical protein EVAR_79730_1 [Eumeta japonica]|uniref:Uncharacterized protein n=1 Tax=Eumeta variegata TaxID=151549 RepID=A0A4C1TA83_EUMVA|nr:hypothetical protein EVAR_79730_1 [Eumeta japonica]
MTRARRTASADWWITPGTAGMRPRDLFTTSRDYRESVGEQASMRAIRESRWLSLVMDTRNPRGVIGVLLSSCVELTRSGSEMIEEEWATGTLVHWTKYNSGIC